jgi:hypothetical protein
MNKKSEKDIVSMEMILDRLEEENAVLISDKEQFIVPVKFLPKNISEGKVVNVTFASNEAEKMERENKAKEILNEILNC